MIRGPANRLNWFQMNCGRGRDVDDGNDRPVLRGPVSAPVDVVAWTMMMMMVVWTVCDRGKW